MHISLVEKMLKTKRLLDMDIEKLETAAIQEYHCSHMKCQFSRQKICPPENAMPS